MTYLIIYQYSGEKALCDDNYIKVIEKIKSFGTWQHPIQCTWVIKSTEFDEKQIRDQLREVMLEDDSVFVVELRKFAGYLPTQFWNWLNNKTDKN